MLQDLGSGVAGGSAAREHNLQSGSLTGTPLNTTSALLGSGLEGVLRAREGLHGLSTFRRAKKCHFWVLAKNWT